MKKFAFLVGLLAMLVQPVRADVLVLVHGYMADARTWDTSGVNAVLAGNGWQPAGVLTVTPEGMRYPASLSAARNKSYSVNVPAAAPLSIQASVLARELSTLRQWYPGERLILAGHSAGGVVARMLVTGTNPYGVDTLITIAAPNLGTFRAAQGLDVVDAKPFFCPGPGIEFMKSVLGGEEYNYLEHSRGALIDLLPAESGNILSGLNRQPHADIHYYAIIHTAPDGSGDGIVPAYSQDLNNVPALRGRVKTVSVPAGHSLNPQDGWVLVRLLTQPRH